MQRIFFCLSVFLLCAMWISCGNNGQIETQNAVTEKTSKHGNRNISIEVNGKPFDVTEIIAHSLPDYIDSEKVSIEFKNADFPSLMIVIIDTLTTPFPHRIPVRRDFEKGQINWTKFCWDDREHGLFDKAEEGSFIEISDWDKKNNIISGNFNGILKADSTVVKVSGKFENVGYE